MKKAAFLSIAMGLAISTVMIQSCKKDDKTTPVVTKPTLYDSLGGTTMVTDPKNSSAKIEQGYLTIRSVVDSSIFVIAADTNINKFFNVLLMEVTSGNTSGFAALSKNLSDFVAVGTGAKNFTYGGKNMVAAHDPAQNPRMNGKAMNDDFDSFETDLVKGAGQNGIMPTNPALQSLAGIIESLRTQVVQN
jgi:hypothetical protein